MRELLGATPGPSAKIHKWVLSIATQQGHDDVVRELRKSVRGRTNLHWAAQYGKTEIVKVLLGKSESQIAVDAKDVYVSGVCVYIW